MPEAWKAIDDAAEAIRSRLSKEETPVIEHSRSAFGGSTLGRDFVVAELEPFAGGQWTKGGVSGLHSAKGVAGTALRTSSVR
jgi:hypothetical protein